ncbi:hypothetical protein [Pararobbsia silviterrae]|uniref:UVR domain-containing protein n=1 Tax=Pararobbsia silviterrae TaxID=1792498 RepID=A0A494X1Y5_9BURK|nr:hypothetical protein [Pararobbsia silviterrae]RKP44727.1 hypothetical protein D7S86_27280 [Pararobbsia silviterrae]
MSLTKAQIDRSGRIVFHDAALHVWEEGGSGGHDASERWERQFKHEVFARIIQTLNRLGWTCSMPPINELDVKRYGGNVARWAAQRQRFCVKGDLKADLSLTGRHIEFEMFQSVNTPTRPDHEGRYESNKEQAMPYLLRLEMERTRRRIRDYLCNVFTGYTFTEPERNRGFNGVTALEWIQAHYEASRHYDKATGRPRGDEVEYNHRSAERARVVHGQRVWFADYKGRIQAGTAYYNINNMWWVVTDKFGLRNIASFELFTKCPDNLRVKRNGRDRRKRLEAELATAVSTMNFERACTLRDILFQKEMPLFHVWHDEHEMYHCAGFCGYTRDSSKAGKFTADECKGWNSKPNRVIPINNEARNAA